MQSLKTLEGISDGKLYTIEDNVKADACGCDGCSACCHHVGDLVALTPFDVYEIRSHLQVDFDRLIGDKIQLVANNKILTPYLNMQKEDGRCSFLNSENRCSIHAHRPNICRLFPLGRVYEEGDYKYFLQVGSCTKADLKEVKVRDWIGISDYEQHKAFTLEWYRLLKALTFRLKFVRDEKELEAMNNYLLDTFYHLEVREGEDFCSVFNSCLAVAKNELGIL